MPRIITYPATRAVQRMPHIKALHEKYLAARSEMVAATTAMQEYRATRKAAWFANEPLPTNGEEVYNRLRAAERRHNALKYVYNEAFAAALRDKIESYK